MPGLPVPLWYNERRVTGGAVATLSAGTTALRGVVKRGGATTVGRSGAIRYVDRSARAGAIIIGRAGATKTVTVPNIGVPTVVFLLDFPETTAEVIHA